MNGMVLMNRQKYYNYISEKIEILSYRIKDGGKLNILDLNIHAETFYRDLLNLLYDFTFEPSNVGKANFEAVDLIDEKAKIVLQVSSTATATKINNTLKKKKIKDLALIGYRIKFVFIAEETNKLRNKVFVNPHNILFNPDTDILDKVSILEYISQLPIDKLTNLNDFIKKEFGDQPSPRRLSSNLATIVSFLAQKNLNGIVNEIQLNDYGIEEKIDFNDLSDIKESTFDEYKIFYGILDRIYEEYIREGSNKVVSVFRKISSFYEKEMLSKNLSEIDKFFNIIEKVEEYVLESDLVKKIPEDEIDMCVRIIVVDAFVRCKIFKNPRGYCHVTPK